MSQQPIRRSADLRRLVEEGYDIHVVAGHLVVRGVPYVDQYRTVRRGQLVSKLDLAGDETVPPRDHYAWFAGSLPCDRDGRPLLAMVHAHHEKDLGPGLRVNHWLCSRPMGREYRDFHEKIETFVLQISTHATALDPTATPRTGRIEASQADDATFAYVDTAASRSGIGALSARLAGQNVGIVGLGGSGAHVLDLISKTPVSRIHLFDDDVFLQHNAFRGPGAASIEDLAERQPKVRYYDRIYSRIHRGIVAHQVRLTAENLGLLDRLDFVFLCMDQAAAKRPIVRSLESNGVSFIDVGMGLEVGEAGITGIVRTTTSTPAMRRHVWDKARVPMSNDGLPDAYSTNVQVNDLNALNAAFAVIRWKRLLGFYQDLESEHFSAYSVDGNHLLNDDLQAPGDTSEPKTHRPTS